MSSAAAAGNRAFGLDRGLPFPLADLDAADARAAARLQPRRDDAAGRRGTSTGARAARRAHRRRPAAYARRAADRRRRRRAPAAGARHRPRARCSALTHIVARRGAGRRRRTSPSAPPGSTDVRRSRRRAGGPSGRAGHRRAGATLRARVALPTGRAGGTARMCSPAAASSSTRGHRHRAPPRSTSRSRWACRAARSGYGALTGQGNGQGGREHGQKADQLPGYRKIDDPAARAHVAGVWGVDPARPARPRACPPSSCSAARHARRAARAAGARVQPGRLRAATRRR